MEPISTGMAIFGVFRATMALGNFILEKQHRAATKTTLNGIDVNVEVVRRNIAEMAADISADFAELNARTDILAAQNDLLAARVEILIGATQALEEAARRFDKKLNLMMEAHFKAGWRALRNAAGANTERGFENYLFDAVREFNLAMAMLRNERLVMAHYGAALAQVQLGELTNALATLEEVASIPFDASAPDSDYWTFLQMKLEMRDYLATLGSLPKLADYWRERTERFYKLADSARSEEAGMQAFRLARATKLLSSDLKAGAEALKSASRGVDETLNAEGAEVYEKTFGEEFVAVEAEPQAGERKVLTIKGVDFAFRYCPAGTFQMGSPSSEAERDSDEGPRHEVTLTKGFWMLETSVTQGMYRAITGSNPSHFKSGDNYPVEEVSWFDSQSFCESLNALGVAPEGFAFRLPTEAEWEYACRAGTDTPYFWGSTLNGDKANCDGNYPYGGVSKGRYLEKTSAVGSYTPNGWGLYDMHGNVYDWCADWFGDYGSGPQTDPTGPSSGSTRVLRGGGWNYLAKVCRSASRFAYGPANRFNDRGFRLVLGR